MSSQGNLEHLCLADIIVIVKGVRLFPTENTKGYGIIVNKEGWILTCYNNVRNTEKITVETISGSELFVEIFEHDEIFNLVILKPKEETGSFKFVNFIVSLDVNLPSHSFLLNDSFVTFEGLICDKHVMLPHHSSLWTVIEIHNNNPENSANFGGPIIVPEVYNFLGIVTDSLVVEEKLQRNNRANNIIFGVASDAINIFLRFIIQKWQEYKALCSQLLKLEAYVVLISQIRANSMQYSRDATSTCNKILEQVAIDMTTLLQTEKPKIVDGVKQLAAKLAPGSVIFEIRFIVTLNSAHQKREAIKHLCLTLHTKFRDVINPDILSVIDVSSLRVFEHWKWFLEWNTALVINKSSIRFMIIDSFLINLLYRANLFTEEEYVILNKEIFSQERTSKFIDIIGNRYPSDVDFIVAVLKQQEQDRIADYFKVLKEKVMKMADKYENAKQESTDNNSSNSQVSNLSEYVY